MEPLPWEASKKKKIGAHSRRSLRPLFRKKKSNLTDEGAYAFVACHGHLTIGHASLSRRSQTDSASQLR